MDAQVPFGAPVEADAHDRQSPAQALSQQNPSTQAPDAQTRHPLTRQSAPAAGSQARPWAFCATQIPSAPQYSLLAQALSSRHATWGFDAHTALVPEQLNGAHEGDPGDPAGSKLHCPSTSPPAATEQALHAPSQGSAQQRPSDQKPVAQPDAAPQGSPSAPPSANAYADPTACTRSSSFGALISAVLPDSATPEPK